MLTFFVVIEWKVALELAKGYWDCNGKWINVVGESSFTSSWTFKRITECSSTGRYCCTPSCWLGIPSQFTFVLSIVLHVRHVYKFLKHLTRKLKLGKPTDFRTKSQRHRVDGMGNQRIFAYFLHQNGAFTFLWREKYQLKETFGKLQ